MRHVDWAATAVGPVDTWPPQLKSLVSMILYARHPMFLWWGPNLVQFYNDGYVPSFGVGRHPGALGQDGQTCWAEIWPVIGPEIEGVLRSAQGTFHEDALVPIFRNGRMEEVYWTYGYSPVFDAQGAVAGVLVVVTETTTRVVAVRRLKTARALADAIAPALRQHELAESAVRVLNGAREDAPWALMYSPAGGSVSVATSGLDAIRSAAIVNAASSALREAPAQQDLVPFELTQAPAMPGDPWPEDSTHAVALRLRAGDSADDCEQLVVGLSPRLPFDRAYEEHLHGIVRLLSGALQRIESQRARIAAEDARNDLLMQAPVAAALMMGPEWRFELANRAYVTMTGREVVGRTWAECFPELRGSAVEEMLARVYAGETFFASEQAVPLARLRDGVIEQRFFDFNVIPLRSRAGAVNGMMVVAVEMTSQVDARRDLERTAVEREALVRQLEAAARAKDEFVAMLGHELRNPLAPISTALHLIALRGVSGVERELEIIGRQVQHLTRLVDDLLDVARIASGKVALSSTVVEMADIVARAIELTSPLIEQRHQRLSASVPSRGLLVRADVARMTQVISNLLTNASKYSNTGEEITIRVERRADRVSLQVEDHGVGIDADMLPLVFELFSQERQSLARSRGGLGLGLAIVRNLVKMHGGEVSAHSAGRGQGARFTVDLPLCEGEAAAHSAREGLTQGAAPAPHRLRILIVDDNEDSAEMLARLLGRLGHETRVAYDGPEALALVDAFAPEVALLDIGLPVMDGYELARELRRRPSCRDARLYALTGYGQADDRKRAREAGFDAHFVKPIDVQAVVQAIAAAQQSARSEQL
jgi:signal transduction histidine kinase/CheY-like chemotaxis protein